MVKKNLTILLIVFLVLSACATEKADPSVSLLGSWKLTSYGPVDAPTPAVADANAELTFKDDGTVTGNSGCNGFGGSYTVDGDQIKFDQIVSTLMACDDPRMAQEQAVQNVLMDTAAFKMEGNTLTLTNNDVVLVLAK